MLIELLSAANVGGWLTMISFREQQYESNKIWYDERKKKNKEEELYWYLTAIGVILRREIRSFVCETESIFIKHCCYVLAI